MPWQTSDIDGYLLHCYCSWQFLTEQWHPQIPPEEVLVFRSSSSIFRRYDIRRCVCVCVYHIHTHFQEEDITKEGYRRGRKKCCHYQDHFPSTHLFLLPHLLWKPKLQNPELMSRIHRLLWLSVHKKNLLTCIIGTDNKMS